MKKIGSGKVREIYEVSDKELVIYTTDRVSAFGRHSAHPRAGKGRVLNQLSLFWFDLTKDIVKNHLVSADPKDMPEEFSKEEYKDRVMLVKKLKMLPYEFIIRGYMFGSMWKAYQAGEPFCGQVITGDYQLAQKLEKPILTPSTKATEGHDEYSVTHEGLVKDLGEELAQKLEDTCLRLFEKCYDYAYERGHHHRRHQAGVRPGRERRAGAGRRGLHPRFQPLLEPGRVPGGHLPLELR